MKLCEPFDLPSGKKAVFREPTNSDKRELQEGFDQAELRKPGRLQEALAYSCLVKLDDQDVGDLTWQKKSDMFNYKDGQFYEQTFVSTCSISKDDYAAAAKLAKDLVEKGTTAANLIVSGKRVIFREPRNADRRGLLDGFDGDELARTDRLDEAVAFTCLEKIGDQDVSNLAWSKRADMLSIKDSQFYQALFMEMYFLGKPELQQVQNLAKKLFGSGTATP